MLLKFPDYLLRETDSAGGLPVRAGLLLAITGTGYVSVNVNLTKCGFGAKG